MSTAKTGGTARASRSASGSSSARGGGAGTGAANVDSTSAPPAAQPSTTSNSKKSNTGAGASGPGGGGNKQQQQGQGGKGRGSSPKRQRQSSSPQQQLAQLPGGAAASTIQPHQQPHQQSQNARHQQRRASNDAASRPPKSQPGANAVSSSSNPAHAAAIAIATAAAAAHQQQQHQQQASMHAQQQLHHHQQHHSLQAPSGGGAGNDATSRSPSLATGSFSPAQYVPTGTQTGGAGYGGGVAHHYGRAASLPGSAVGGSSNGRVRASTANYGGGGGGGGVAGQSSAAAASAATLAALAVQNGQLAQQLAAMGGYTRANGSPATPSLAALSAQHQQQQQQYAAQHYNSVLQLAYERHTVELTNCIIAFLSPILPTEEEYRIKEATRRQLERLAGKVSPGAKLLAFGSMANGFALRNSDMDLCCLIGKDSNGVTPPFNASELVETLGQLIREETDFNVMALPKARIPIIKISRPPTAELPYDISCDIGFENRLALENTRLLLSYAMVDPPRLRTLVLFLKVWTKRRKLNSPYTGTLSSYGYTLLVLFFLTHVKRPAVLPNLQRIPPARTLAQEEVELNGHNIYFYDDVATLRQEWASQNMENVGELLIDFFRYFSKEFAYTKDVISLRTEGGLIAKDNEAWSAELCIEDPFQLGYNVSRTVTKDGLYTIRGEFIRATRILTNQKERVSSALAELCEEREDGLSRAPDAPFHHHHQQHRRPPPPHAANVADARLMRDVYHREGQRRYDAPGASAFNGSFAFEEMARGLGQGQGQRNAMARPTAAMLAPLSQSGGLSSPRQSRGQRTGTRYDGGRHSQPGTTTVPSSARSEDGTGSSGYDAASKTSRASARTSPNYQRVTPTNGAVGEAQLLGNEISMQRLPSANAAVDATLLSPQAAAGASRGARSHSEGQPLNRSMSLPRGNMPPPLDFGSGAGKNTGPKQRIQLPLRSEPGSPSMAGQPPYGDFDAVTALSGMTLDVSGQSGPQSSSGCGSSRSASPLPPGSDNGTPYIAHSPWGFLQPSMAAGGGGGSANMYRTGSASPSGHSFTLDALDDGDSSISEGTLDELARISALEAANGSSGEAPSSPQMPPTLAPSARTRIHSWAQASTPRQPEFAAGAGLPDAHLPPPPAAASSNGNSPNEIQRAQFADGIVQAQAKHVNSTASTLATAEELQDMPTPTKRSH